MRNIGIHFIIYPT